ncbi:MAG: carboxypeptidase regulatory-like domain-containing protein [Terriglobales bacterium]
MKCLAAVLLLALTLPAVCQYAAEGSIEGVVSDSTGAILRGVSLQARSRETAAVSSTRTNELGLFRFPILPIGTYEVVAARPGFATIIVKEVAVTLGARVNLSLALPIATRTDNIEITEEPPLLESTRSQVSSIVDQRLIANLPLNGRNLYGFVALVPGVRTAANGNGLNFAGQLNSFLVDGVDDTDTFFNSAIGGTAGANSYQLSQEAVREFQVNINAYSAELGRVGSGLVNVVTKSGTNDYHGDVFWYFRDKGLNATDAINKWVGQAKDPLHVHQFGGAIGGPLVRKKLFFFAGYDGQRRTEQNLTYLNLPSSFKLSSSAKVAAFQQRALDYLTPRDAPWIRSFDQNVYLSKLDWHISSTHLLSGRWNRQRYSGANLLGSGPQTSVENTGALAQNNDILAISLTSTLSPFMVNAARFSFVSTHQPGDSNSVNPAANVLEGGQLVLNVGRNSTAPREIIIRRTEYADTLSFNRGRHAMRTGVNLLLDGVTFTTAISFSGVYRFNSLESFGRSLAGSPVPIAGDRFTQSFSGEGAHGNVAHPNSTEAAAFFEDEWRLFPSLTLNLGLRYDIQVMAEASVKNPSAALAAAGLDTSFVPLDGNNLAPRIGFAWNPWRERLVVRGGYGIFYPRTNAGQLARVYYQNGVSVQTRNFIAGTPSAALIPAYPNTLCGPPDPSGMPPNCPPPVGGSDVIMPFAPNYRQPMVQQGSFGIEFQPSKNLSVSISYLAQKGTHLERYRDMNLPQPSAATIAIAGTSITLPYPLFSDPRPIAGFDRILLLGSEGSSTYHSLAAQVTKRFSRNFQFLAAYTFAKSIDDNPDPSPLNPGSGDNKLLSDSFTPHSDRGPSDADQRHRFVLSGTWQLDYARSFPRMARLVLQGWEVSGILTAHSGRTYSPMVNFDLNNDGNAVTDRTPGAGRNAFYSPPTYSLDPRLTRNLPFGERLRLQVIWEAFNVFNRANVTSVRNTQFSRATTAAACGIVATPCLVPQNTGLTAFGVPNGTSGPRIMQFAMKLLF